MIFRNKFSYLIICFVFVLSTFGQNNYLFDSTSIQITPLNINTDESEFAPFKVGKILYYSSSQERKIGAISMDDATLHQLLDLYSGVFSDSVKVRSVKPLSDRINNALNQGSCFFDKDSSRLYYSSDTYAKFNRTNKNYKLAIYSSKYLNGEFGAPRTELVLPDTFSASHPMVYNNKLYFSANLEGGWGKTDIYTAEKVDGEWKYIKNLAQLNSAENEFFPFVVNENEIYFSSSKPGGFGKLDLYKCTIEGDKAITQNLGYFINSSEDDFAIYIDSLEESGYFSTNRVGLQDDIYYFSKTWPSFKNCAEPVVEDYCYNLSEESTMNTDSLKNYYYEWLLGDGSKERGLEIRHCFPGPGKYLINLNVVDVTTKTVFMTQATFDLDVDSIVQLKISSLDTVCVQKEFNISTKGTFLPDKKITGYYFELENKRLRTNNFDYKFSETGTYPVKLGITYNSPGSKKKELMCTEKRIVVVEPKVWAKVEERRIEQEVIKFTSPLLKFDSLAMKNFTLDDNLAAKYKQIGLNGDKVVDAIKEFIDKRTLTGNKPEETSATDKALALKNKSGDINYKTAETKIDTVFNLKEEKDVSFKVHMGTSVDKKDTTAISANGVTGIEEKLINGVYHYTFGNETKIDSIEKFYRNCIKAGIEKPMVIAYKNGEVIFDQSKNIIPATFYEDKSRIIPKPANTATADVVAVNGKTDSLQAQNNNEDNIANTKNKSSENPPREKLSDANQKDNDSKENNSDSLQSEKGKSVVGTNQIVKPNEADSLQEVNNKNLTKIKQKNKSEENKLIANQKDDSDVTLNKDDSENNRGSSNGRDSNGDRNSDSTSSSNITKNKNLGDSKNELVNENDYIKNENQNNTDFKNKDTDVSNSSNENNKSENTENENSNLTSSPKKNPKNKNPKNNKTKNKNEYHEEIVGNDSNGEITNTSNEINEALEGGVDFVPKTKIQKQILVYLKKFGDVSAKDLEFKVQVGVFRHRKRWHFPKLKGLGDIETESIDHGLTRMTIGKTYKTLREAFELNKRVVRAGQEDAFVSVYYKGKRIYIENLDKRNVFKNDENDSLSIAAIDEENLIENSKVKSKKKTKEKTEQKIEETNPFHTYVEYDTRNFEPKTLIQRQTMDFIDKYGDISVEGLEFKVQVGLYKYRKSDNFPKLKQFGKITMKEIENGITQMTIGGTFKTQREAFELNKKVIMAGQSDAFVAVYYFGKRTYMINLEKKGIFTVK